MAKLLFCCADGTISFRSEHKKYPSSLPVDVDFDSEEEAGSVRILACVTNYFDGRYQLPHWPIKENVLVRMQFAAARLLECRTIVRARPVRKSRPT